MAGYAAAMDASMSDESSSQDMTTALVSGTSSPPEGSEHEDGPSGVGRPPENWESNTGEDLNHTSLSMCVPEVSCKKRRGETQCNFPFCATVLTSKVKYNKSWTGWSSTSIFWERYASRIKQNLNFKPSLNDVRRESASLET